MGICFSSEYDCKRVQASEAAKADGEEECEQKKEIKECCFCVFFVLILKEDGIMRWDVFECSTGHFN